MADSKISELDLYNTISGNEEIAFAKGGANGKLTMQTVLNEARKDKVESEGYDSVVGDLEANLLTDALRKTPQVLSESEQQTARANIGAQGALRTSADLALRDDVLSLTDMAKKRLFIDLWNQAAGDYGRYNEDTGYFELFEIYDIGWDEALLIYRISGQWDYSTVNFSWSDIGVKSPITPRAFLPCTRAYNGENVITVASNFHNDSIQYLSLVNKATGNDLRCIQIYVKTHGFRFDKAIKMYGTIQIGNVMNIIDTSLLWVIWSMASLSL